MQNEEGNEGEVNAAISLTGLFSATRSASQDLEEKRLIANEEAKQAIEAIEGQLLEAIDYDKLRGMPNLLPDGFRPFYAMRVNVEGPRSTYLPRDGRTVLVLTDTGMLLNAAWRRVGDLIEAETFLLKDRDYRADLLDPYISAVQEALQGHLARTERRVDAYERASALAQKIAGVVGSRLQIRGEKNKT